MTVRTPPIIRDVLVATSGQPEREIKRALRDAYPFGLREYHPYKIWCDEVRRQRGTKPAAGPCTCTHAKGSHHGRAGKCVAADCRCDAYQATDPNQATLL